MSKQIILTAMMMCLASTAALAMSASEAKNKGLIQEDCSGYVTAIKPEGKSVASEINAKRREEYSRLAAQQKVSVDVVAATTGAKLCGR